MKFRINKLNEKIIFLILILTLFSGILIDYNPNFKIIGQFTLVLELLVVLLYLILNYNKIKIKRTSALAMLFIVWSVISFTWSSGGGYYFFERIRYFIIGAMLFVIVCDYVNFDFAYRVMDLLFFAQILNTILTIYQNEFLGLHPDFCNGIFGTYDYFNAAQGTISALISILCLLHYINNTWHRKKSLVAILLSFIVCAFSEVKIFFVLFLLSLFIIVMMQINDRTARRKIFRMILIALLAFYVAWQILLIIMPENLKVFTDFQLYLAYENYGARGGVGRMNGFSYVYTNVFDENILKALVGKGIGSATGKYVYEFPLLFHEEGLIGVLLFVSYLISAIFDGIAISKYNQTKWNGVFLITWSFTTIVSLFVWNAIFAKCMPFIFIFMAVGYIGMNNREELKVMQE